MKIWYFPNQSESCGAELIVLNAVCLPKIYAQLSHYIDLYNYDDNLAELLREPIAHHQKCWTNIRDLKKRENY